MIVTFPKSMNEEQMINLKAKKALKKLLVSQIQTPSKSLSQPKKLRILSIDGGGIRRSNPCRNSRAPGAKIAAFFQKPTNQVE